MQNMKKNKFFKLRTRHPLWRQGRCVTFVDSTYLLNSKSPFTRQKSWVRSRGKSGTNCIISTVYTDNNLLRVAQKVGYTPGLEGCIYTTHFGVGAIFNVRLWYCACQRRFKKLLRTRPSSFFCFFFLFLCFGLRP